MTARSVGPQRIVCLTEEPTEVLYALGEQDRIVGISGFTVRPPRARKEKPKVSAFTSAKIGEILKLEPDFVVGFSDIQADIAAELIRHGIEVWISNHRSVDGILDYIARLGALVGAGERANAYADELRAGLERIAARSRAAAATAQGLFRGVGRPDDQRASSWVSRTDRHRRWRRHLPGVRGVSRWPRVGSWRIPTKSSGARRTSSWAHGAARNSARKKWPRAPAGTRFPRCAMASCTRSSRRSSCSPGRRR